MIAVLGYCNCVTELLHAIKYINLLTNFNGNNDLLFRVQNVKSLILLTISSRIRCCY